MRRFSSLLLLFAIVLTSIAAITVPAAATPYAAIVEPNADVLDGQTITVYWSGYTAGWGNDVRQCKSQVFDLETDCSRSFGGVTTVDGTGAIQVRVTREVTNAAQTAVFVCDADNPCGVLVQRDNRDPTTRAFAPIFFAGSSRPLATCADDSPDTLVTGGGASAVIEAFRRWIQQLCQPLAGSIAVDYTFRNSPEGRAAFINQLTDFGATSGPFTTADLAALKAQGRDSAFVYVPVAASAMGIVYNAWYKDPNPDGDLGREVFRQVRDLCLSPEAAARVLTGTTSYLYDGSDSTILNDNPQLASLAASPQRPLATPVKPVARADASYSTLALTSWIQSDPGAAAAWAAAGDEFGGVTVTDQFPAARAVDGRTLVQNTMKLMVTFGGEERRGDLVPRSAWFTWADVTVARSYGLPVAKIRDSKSGNCVEPTPESIGLGLAAMTENADGVTRSLAFGPNVDARAYPMPTITYLVVPTSGLSAEKATALKRMLEFIVGPGQERLSELGYVPLPSDLLEVAQAQVEKVSGTGAVELPPASIGGESGTFDNSLFTPQALTDPLLSPTFTDPLASSATSSGTGDEEARSFDFIRFVTSDQAVPVLLVLVLGIAAIAAGPLLHVRARRAARGGP